MSVSSIAREMGCSRNTVALWLRRWEESENLSDRPRPGKARVTSAEEDGKIFEEVQRSPITNAEIIRTNLQLNCDTRTVRRRLHAAGVHHRTPAVKEKLLDRHKDARLAFARRHVFEDLSFWSRVIFSDEKTFSSSTYGRARCWRPNNTRYDTNNILEVARSGHVTCNVWGWIFLHGIGELAQISGRFTAEKYLEILEEVMLPSVRSFALPYPERIIFMQVK